MEVVGLMCVEDTRSVLGLEEEEEKEEVGGFGDEDGFPPVSEEGLGLMVVQEGEHLPRGDYGRRLLDGALDISVRREAIDWIGKVHAHYGFGPLSAYLSINYLDRFLSCYDLPKGKTWMTQLLSVACLSLAAKMEETDVPLSIDLQVGEAKYVFEPKTIQRMELLLLSTLKWRMRAMTPFSFVDYFLRRFSNGRSPSRLLLSKATDLIMNMIRRIDFLEFKPSEVAAAVALCLTAELEAVDVNKVLSSCIHLDNERALRCYEEVRDMALISRPFKNTSGSASSVPQSPIGVLDDACFSYTSDDTTCSPHFKRRKLEPDTLYS